MENWKIYHESIQILTILFMRIFVRMDSRRISDPEKSKIKGFETSSIIQFRHAHIIIIQTQTKWKQLLWQTAAA